MNRAFLVLGSNIDKEQNMPAAIRLLRQMCRVVAVSSIYETIPIGRLEQPTYFNAAVLIETEKNAWQLKEEVLSQVERRLGRQRQADKNAPRTIDVDLALFNDEVFDYGPDDGPRHHIPDPDLLKFAHAAVPIAEIAPHTRHPETADPLSTIAERIMNAARMKGFLPLWKRPDIVV